MTEAVQQLKSRLSELSSPERAELAHFLLQSLDQEVIEDSDEEIEASWEVELERRVEAVRSGKAVEIPAEEVLKALREKYP